MLTAVPCVSRVSTDEYMALLRSTFPFLGGGAPWLLVTSGWTEAGWAVGGEMSSVGGGPWAAGGGEKWYP